MSKRAPARLRPAAIALLASLLICLAGCSVTTPTATPITQTVPGAPPTQRAGSGVPQPGTSMLATGATPLATLLPTATSTPTRPPRATTQAVGKTTRTPLSPAQSGPPIGVIIATPPASDRLPTLRFAQLPIQAQQVIALIAAGGPFPYRQDGAVFQNREGLLPHKPRGYYHEYTVETPGSPDRGARRIIAGAENETYYTGDHYASFRRVVP